ncbi:MAG: ABC transporter ATP-binding protein [Alphaproteobacteria bacterium]|nr:ABC transporter ATP-binding protein [Alphaproteobacteria bacterium]
MTEPLLDVRDLRVSLRRSGREVSVVDGVSLAIAPGEFVGLVGESGCGKSMTAFGLVNLFPTPAAHLAGGTVTFHGGRRLDGLPPAAMRRIRGAEIGMVFQDPNTYLDPLLPIGHQIAEALREHDFAGDVDARVLELLTLMEIPDPALAVRRFPHELSGGQRQRALIAAALAMNPKLLIADEPTTALDVTIQAAILDLLRRLRRQLGIGVLLITHDLGVIAETCDRVYVMYAGRIVESNTTASLFATPRHPYSQGLIKATLRPDRREALFSIPGQVPSPDSPPAGCRFHPRCPIAIAKCMGQSPELVSYDSGSVACHRAHDPAARTTWSASAA